MSVSEIGRRLKNARLNSRMTQAEVANKLGLTYQAISNYERGTTRVDAETLSKLCQIYGTSVSAILKTAVWDKDMFDAYKNASSDAERLRFLDLWGVPAELMESANMIREPDQNPLTALDESILYAYHHASSEDRAIIDNIVRRYTQGMRCAQELSQAPAEVSKTETTTSPDIAARMTELERQNKEKDKQIQALAAKVAAMEEEDAAQTAGRTG